MAPSNIPKNKQVFSGIPGIENHNEGDEDCLDRKFLDGSRYDETVIGSCELPLSFPAGSTNSWRTRRKIKTQDIILTLCLDFGQFSEGSANGCGMGDECWINLNSIHDKNNLFRRLALSLQKRYEDQVHSGNGIRTKHLLDPSVANVETVCEEVRANGDKMSQGRVIFHYNGHGVLPPTVDLGEIWVFNKRYNKYKPIPISVIHSWLKTPTLYVMDCSHAGCLLEHLMELNTDIIEDETKDVLFLGACDTFETLPVHPDFPADIFTACLTDPLRMSIRWYLHMRHIQPFHFTKDIINEETIEEDFAYRLEGSEHDRDLPRGKLRMIFDCITDCIAWNTCDNETYKMLFKTDEMVAALFRNFLLAQRIMGFFYCHPVSKPQFPDMSEHYLWRVWDSVIEDFLCQYAKAQQSENGNEMKLANPLAFTSPSSILSYPSLYQQQQQQQQQQFGHRHNIHRSTTPDTSTTTTTTMMMMMTSEGDNEMGKGKAGEAEQGEERDPYWHIRQRPAHLVSSALTSTTTTPSSTSSRNSTRDRSAGTSNVLSRLSSSQKAKASFTFKTSFFRSILQELYTFVTTSRNLSDLPDCFSMMAQLLNSDEMSQQLSLHNTINVIELFADFAERSNEAVVAILTSVNFVTLKRISFRAQRQHRAALLRLWVCIASYDYHVHEDIIQNLFQFLLSFLRPDAEPPATGADILRVEYLLSIACHESNLARMKCREHGLHQLIKKYINSSDWKLRCWTCILLSQLAAEHNELKEVLYNDHVFGEALALLKDSRPEVRAAALVFLQVFVGMGANDTAVVTGSIHEYLSKEDIELLIEQPDPSMKYDRMLLDHVSKRMLMNRECSVLVRRELLRLILKVFCRNGHLAHMICFVDRVLKNQIDLDSLLQHVDEEDAFTTSPTSSTNHSSHNSSSFNTSPPVATGTSVFSPPQSTISSLPRRSQQPHHQYHQSHHQRKQSSNYLYMKYWIMFLSLRDAEPHLPIRKAAAHYVNVVCKNVDNLKNNGTLPATPSIFDFATLLQLSQTATASGMASQRGSLHRQSSVSGLPTIQRDRSELFGNASTVNGMGMNPTRSSTNLPVGLPGHRSSSNGGPGGANNNNNNNNNNSHLPTLMTGGGLGSTTALPMLATGGKTSRIASTNALLSTPAVTTTTTSTTNDNDNDNTIGTGTGNHVGGFGGFGNNTTSRAFSTTMNPGTNSTTTTSTTFLPTLTTGTIATATAAATATTTAASSFCPRSMRMTSRAGTSLIPPAIATSPSFGNLQLCAQGTSTCENTSHLDSWLEIQLQLVGLPATFIEWCINKFVIRVPTTTTTTTMAEKMDGQISGNDLTSEDERHDGEDGYRTSDTTLSTTNPTTATTTTTTATTTTALSVGYSSRGGMNHFMIRKDGYEDDSDDDDFVLMENELAEYHRLQQTAQRKPVHALTQKDVFFTDEGAVECISFHPCFNLLAVGVPHSTMIYDYHEKRKVYSMTTTLEATPTDFAWINPGRHSLLVEATRRGGIYVWDLPRLHEKRQPRLVTSFLAFPVFAKESVAASLTSSSTLPQQQQQQGDTTNATRNHSKIGHSSLILDWSQTTGLLACGGSTQMVKVWDMEKERLVCCKETGYFIEV